MLITLCAILMSILLMFFAPLGIHLDETHLTVIMLTGGTALLLGTIFLYTFILIPLEHLEQKLIPNLMQLVRHDGTLHAGRVILFLFPLISYLCVALIPHIENIHYQHWFFFGWLIFFGIALDIFRDSWRRLVNFLNPSFLVSRISNQAEKAIQNDNRTFLLNDFDSLAEIALRAVEKSKLALSTQALQTFPPLLKIFFDSSKSIGHASRDLNTSQDIRGGDESSFLIFYLLQRLELIYDKALRDRQETVCRQMVMMMGKIIIHCAQFDLSMVSFPTHFLTKFGLKAQQHHFDEVTELTTSTLLEVAKTILTEIDITYAELEEPFQAIINGLTAIARGSFKKRKDTSIKVLVQPLVDLKALFQTEKMAQHRDTPAIVQKINNVLDEFAILEQVMQTIPTIPDMEPPEGTAPSEPTPTV
jgi:hypothetical protein